MQQLFQQGINYIISLFIPCLQHVQHACNCNKNTVAYCCTATARNKRHKYDFSSERRKSKNICATVFATSATCGIFVAIELSSPIIMPKFSISDAAKRAGVERTTLYRKIDKGELSAEIDAHGTKVIDASELLRVYPDASVIDNRTTGMQQMRTVETQQNATADATMAVLLREAEMREEKIEDMKRRIEALEADKTDLRSERDRLLKVIEEQSASVKLLTAGDQTKAKTGRRFLFFGRRS